MSQTELAAIKPEALKSFIWVQYSDGTIVPIEEEVAMFCPMICRERLKNNSGSSKKFPVSLPERVSPASLSLILEYCRFHQVPGRSNKERKSYDERFVKIETGKLCELTSAADILQLKPLVDLASRALARKIEGKSPEEIRETFNLPDDLTEEEKLEPLRNYTDDPRIRLLNRLYAKKRKELKERQNAKDVPAELEQKDERSVDEILNFINGDERTRSNASKDDRASKSKKKNKPKKDPIKKPKEEVASFAANKPKVDNKAHTSLDAQDWLLASSMEFEDSDTDDELDPIMKKELDREVEDFARRLNSLWAERVQEILQQSCH